MLSESERIERNKLIKDIERIFREKEKHQKDMYVETLESNIDILEERISELENN